MEKYSVEFKNVNKKMGGVNRIDNLTLNLSKGKIYAINIEVRRFQRPISHFGNNLPLFLTQVKCYLRTGKEENVSRFAQSERVTHVYGDGQLFARDNGTMFSIVTLHF